MIVFRDGRPFFAMSSPGGDGQEQKALQVFLSIAVFDMRPEAAVEARRLSECSPLAGLPGHAGAANPLVYPDFTHAARVEANE